MANTSLFSSPLNHPEVEERLQTLWRNLSEFEICRQVRLLDALKALMSSLCEIRVNVVMKLPMVFGWRHSYHLLEAFKEVIVFILKG